MLLAAEFRIVILLSQASGKGQTSELCSGRIVIRR